MSDFLPSTSDLSDFLPSTSDFLPSTNDFLLSRSEFGEDSVEVDFVLGDVLVDFLLWLDDPGLTVIADAGDGVVTWT